MEMKLCQRNHGALRRSTIIKECCNFDYKIIA